jgi:hypothetical protein
MKHAHAHIGRIQRAHVSTRHISHDHRILLSDFSTDRIYENRMECIILGIIHRTTGGRPRFTLVTFLYSELQTVMLLQCYPFLVVIHRYYLL